MLGVGPLQLAWYVEWAVRLQRRIGSPTERYLATLATVAALGLVVGVALGLGRLLRDRADDEVIRGVQWSLVTVTSVALSAFLVAVWRLTTEVRNAFGFIAIGPETFIRTLVTCIALAAGYSVTRLTKRSVRYGTERETITAHQREIVHHLVQITVFVPVAAFVIALWGIPVRNLFLGAGALGIIVGFAARQTLSGALSGFVILFARPFEIGDWVRIGDREGIVTDVTLYNTQVRTFNEEHVLVPNDQVTGSEVVNYTSTPRLRITTDIGVDYDCDVGRAAAVAEETMADLDAVADTPAPDVIRHAFDDSAVVLRLRFWVEPATIQRKWQAQNAVVEGVKAAFEREDISIPFPQRALTQRRGPRDRGSTAPRAEPETVADDDGSTSRARGADAAVDGEEGGT